MTSLVSDAEAGLLAMRPALRTANLPRRDTGGRRRAGLTERGAVRIVAIGTGGRLGRGESLIRSASFGSVINDVKVSPSWVHGVPRPPVQVKKLREQCVKL
jgi:hypothetical protein